jgi:hypothetical protein
VSFIVVGPQVLDLLKQHRERQLEIQEAMGERNHDEGWVFCRTDNGKPYDPKTFYEDLPGKPTSFSGGMKGGICELS